jgi:hypothetical protein
MVLVEVSHESLALLVTLSVSNGPFESSAIADCIFDTVSAKEVLVCIDYSVNIVNEVVGHSIRWTQTLSEYCFVLWNKKHL